MLVEAEVHAGRRRGSVGERAPGGVVAVVPGIVDGDPEDVRLAVAVGVGLPRELAVGRLPIEGIDRRRCGEHRRSDRGVAAGHGLAVLREPDDQDDGLARAGDERGGGHLALEHTHR